MRVGGPVCGASHMVGAWHSSRLPWWRGENITCSSPATGFTSIISRSSRSVPLPLWSRCSCCALTTRPRGDGFREPLHGSRAERSPCAGSRDWWSMAPRIQSGGPVSSSAAFCSGVSPGWPGHRRPGRQQRRIPGEALAGVVRQQPRSVFRRQHGHTDCSSTPPHVLSGS